MFYIVTIIYTLTVVVVMCLLNNDIYKNYLVSVIVILHYILELY